MSNKILLFLILFFTTTSATSSPPSLSYSPADIADILSHLGYHELSNAVATSKHSYTIPITIFAPSDASMLSCSSCLMQILVDELSFPGLYDLKDLLYMIFQPNRCITVSSSGHSLFFKGMEITRPDLFNNGWVIIHGISGSVSHLSSSSCNVVTSRFLPQLDHNLIMNAMLKDAIMRLEYSGYRYVSIFLELKYQELMKLRSVTTFALDDDWIISDGGEPYFTRFMCHVVPDMWLTGDHMEELLPSTVLPTMEVGESLVVTTGGVGVPMTINFVKVPFMDSLHNARVVVHGITSAFPHIGVNDCDVHGSLVGDSVAGSEKAEAACWKSDGSSGVCLAGGQGLSGGSHFAV